jgi:O-antigen/teichoic acid export membrane protein
MLRLIRDRLQLDRALAFALATRVWQAISGPITIALLIRTLNLSEQGVYYAIVGIIGIQAYFELGLLNVLVSHSGHQWAELQKASRQAADVDHPKTLHPQWIAAAAGMRDLIQASFRWFAIAALLYVASAMAFGWFTLSGSAVNWQYPLLALIPITAVSVWLAPGLSILEGAGERDLVYRFRFLQMCAGSLVVWLALALESKLWALVFSALVQALIMIYVTWIARGPFFHQFRSLAGPPSNFRWTRDVLPVQWRVALIGASFHFATQFFAVIVLMFHGDAEAGPLGMTLSISTAIQMLALAWVQTKFPLVASYHGEGDRVAAGTLWRRTAIVSTSLLVMAFALLTALIALLPMVGMGLEFRFIRPWQVAMLSLGCLANHIAAVQGFYVLSMRARPLLRASLIGSISTAAAVWIGGYLYSTSGVVTGYALAMALILVPFHTWAYYQFRARI